MDHYFKTAIDAVLKNWTALQLAVTQNAAGVNSKQIADWMTEATYQWFSENSNLESYEVTEFLETIINQEFNVLIEDGSTDEVGSTICELYNFIIVQKKSEDEIVTKLKSLPKCNLESCKVTNDDDEVVNITSIVNNVAHNINELSVSEGNNSDSRPRLNEPDEDGWVTIPTKKKQNR